MPRLASALALGVFTIAVYALTRRLYLRTGQRPLLHPILISVAVVIAAVELTGGLPEYRPVKDLAAWLLGPVTAALAVPVYRHRRRLNLALTPLLVGVLCGVLSTVAAVLALGAVAGLAPGVLHALALKSATTPVAIELAPLQGADPSLTTALVVCTGLLGALLGPTILSWARVTQPLARGIALGTISHALGTATALTESEAAGAVSSLSMVGAALSTALLAPVCLSTLQWLLGHH